MKTLVFVTSQFPFGTGESFIGSEFPFLAKSFDKILIISQNVKGSAARETSGNTKVFRYDTSTSLTGMLKVPILIISNFLTVYKMVRDEICFRLSKDNHLSFKNKLYLIKKIIKALQLRDFIRKTLTSEGINDSIVFYSYWLKTGAHAISMLRYRNSIRIARAHGSDIYEEKTESGYLPLLRFSAANLDAIFFISENGRKYLEEKAGLEKQGFIVSYLGVEGPGKEIKPVVKSDLFTVVSCSNIVPLKRIHLIIKALALVRSPKKIDWIHFGDGILKNDLETLAGSILQPQKNINYRFVGHFTNDKLMEFYSSNQVDLFVNTSSTEGVPVSIMEAQSFGIPVIATDTGGVKELVDEGTGFLLPVDFKPEELAEMIEDFAELPENETNILRANSVTNWNFKFNATSNYTSFIMKVSSILASAK